MSTREQNDFLTQTGPDTPVGNVLRRYWIPALLAEKLDPPDGAAISSQSEPPQKAAAPYRAS